MEMSDQFTINDLAAKCKSKAEFYNLLTTEGGMYLPPIQDSTQAYLRGIMMGKKDYIKSKNVLVTKVPHYKNLTVSKILRFARSKGDINKYIPDYKYNKEPNREWLWNVINTLIPEEFSEFVSRNIALRKNELIKSQNLSITAMPEFISIFKTSQSVSMHKGRSHFLTREPKLSKDKILIGKIEEERQNSERKIQKLEVELLKLSDKIVDLEKSQENASENKDKLAKLFDLGIINENGEFINNEIN